MDGSVLQSLSLVVTRDDGMIEDFSRLITFFAQYLQANGLSLEDAQSAKLSTYKGTLRVMFKYQRSCE